jgi:uncharacterized protein (TIGR02996 family)
VTEHAAFIAAICSDRADDTVRLVFADWLEENSIETDCAAGCGISLAEYNTVFDPSLRRYVKCPHCHGTGRIPDGRRNRAAFVRVQCELARLHDDADPKRGVYFIDGQGHYAATPERRRYEELQRREQELWMNDVGRAENWPSAFDKVYLQLPAPTNAMLGLVSRGFVSALSCTWDAFSEHADALFWHPDQLHRGKPRPCPETAQPLERVTLTTMPNATALNKRLRKMKDGEDWQYNLSLRHFHRSRNPVVGPAWLAYLKDLCEACWPGVAFELPAAQTGPERHGQIVQLPHDFLTRDYTNEGLEQMREAGRRWAMEAELRAIEAITAQTGPADPV